MLAASNDPLVLVVRTDPKPIDAVALDISQRSVTRVTDSNRPNFADFLEMKRRQSRIRKPEAIRFASVAANRFGKAAVSFPKPTVR
jgi:hypothetical protein